MLVGSIFVRVEVDVREGPAIGVLRISYTGDLEPHEPVGQHLLRVGTCPLAEAAYGLARGHSLRRVDSYQADGLDLAVDFDGDGVAVGDIGDLAVDLIRAAQTVDQAVEAHPRDRIEQ